MKQTNDLNAKMRKKKKTAPRIIIIESSYLKHTYKLQMKKTKLA